MQVFCHGDCYTDVKRIAGVTVAMQDEVARDRAFWNLNCGSVWAAQSYGSEGVSDSRMGNAAGRGLEMGAAELNGSTGKCSRRSEIGEMRE
jgi:hypothetical protein